MRLLEVSRVLSRILSLSPSCFLLDCLNEIAFLGDLLGLIGERRLLRSALIADKTETTAIRSDRWQGWDWLAIIKKWRSVIGSPLFFSWDRETYASTYLSKDSAGLFISIGVALSTSDATARSYYAFVFFGHRRCLC